MRRPLVYMAIFTAAAAALCSLGAGTKEVCAAAAMAAFVCSLIFFVINKGVARPSARAAAIFTVSAALAAATALGFGAMERRAAELAEDCDGKELTLEGEVYRPPVIYDNREVSVIKTELGLVELTRYGSYAENPEVGDHISITAETAAPARAKNDFGFDNRNYLYSRRIFLTAVGGGDMKITKFKGFSPWVLAGKIQTAALRRGEQFLSGDALGLYGAAVFGDRRHMSYDLRRKLNTSGLGHIAAVSGTHLSAMTMILMFLMIKLFGRGRPAYAASIAGTVLFALVTGASPSVTRACIMGTIYLLAKIVYREADGLTSLSAAVTLMLLFNPMLIYAASFGMSVTATLGILLFTPLFADKIKRLPFGLRQAAELAAVSAAAQLGALPVLIASFNCFPIYFIIANIAAVPMLSLAILSGLALPAVGGVPVIGPLWRLLCSATLNYIAFVADRVSALPHASVPMEAPDMAEAAAYAAALAAAYFLCRRRGRAAALTAAAAVALTAFCGVRIAENRKTATLSFLNVGRGDCAVFCLPDGKTVLVDGGNDGFDAEDYLLGRGRSRIDAAVVTSVKREHFGGIAELAEDGAVGNIFIPAELAESDAVKTLETDANVEFYDGETVISVGGLELRRSAYNEGAALLADYGEQRILFCTDSYTDWPACDIVKTPNHGAGKYNYLGEISRSMPRFAVISGRKSAVDGCAYLPALFSSGAEVVSTAENGTVTFVLDGEPTLSTTY